MVAPPYMRSVRRARSPKSPSSPKPIAFTDIETHWARTCILELAQRKWVVGDALGRFRPDAPLTRAEFAALMYWVFPQALPVRKARPFLDVPAMHWAYKTVKWVYERGIFSGYGNQQFRPDVAMTRLEALMALVRGLKFVLPAFSQDLLTEYYDDEADIPQFAKGAIAAATLVGLVVNYPDVRQLRPHAPITRAEVAALLCQILKSDDALPLPYLVWTTPLEALPSDRAIPFAALRGNARLVKQLQTKLAELKLQPGETAINGQFTAETEAALLSLCTVLKLPNAQTKQLDATLTQTLLTLEPVCFILEQTRDRNQVMAEYLQQEAGYNAAKLAFLDRGLESSPLRGEVPNYPISLTQVPSATPKPALPVPAPFIPNRSIPDRSILGRSMPSQPMVSLVASRAPAPPSPPAKPLTAYPNRGDLPVIDPDGLNFLHEDIQQACVCVGEWVDGAPQTRWLGRQALSNVELWSATKIIPLLHVVSQINTRFLQADIDNELVRPRRGSKGYSFHQLALDIVNYNQSIGSSNSLAAMLKQFDTPQNLENWLKSITGNTTLVFRGRYGEGAFIAVPELWDQSLKQVVLAGSGSSHRGNNTLSTYDLTRLMTMLAWHTHLPPNAQLPGAQWHSLESLVRALGADSARYVDVAIARLGLSRHLTSPVVISKLGFGRSAIRHRTELVYTAYVQFLDRHPCQTAQATPPRWRSLGLTLISAKKLGNGDREATELDARMAAEVTELLRRLVTDEL